MPCLPCALTRRRRRQELLDADLHVQKALNLSLREDVLIEKARRWRRRRRRLRLLLF